MKVEITEYTIHNGAIRWRISTSVKVIWRVFAIALLVSDRWMFQICYFESLGWGDEVQYAQRSYSMENINLHKSRPSIFANFHRFRDINISKFVTLKI